MTEQSKLSTQASNLQSGSTQDSPGEWMSLMDAAAASGLSVITIRRYIKGKRLKSRRLGKSVNAKLQVFLTPEILASDEDRISTEGLDDVLATSEAELVDFEEQDLLATEQSDQVTAETMNWLRERLDQSLNEIQSLHHQLHGANFRNGYLESQLENYEKEIKLLTQKPDQSERVTTEIGRWQKFKAWFFGSRS